MGRDHWCWWAGYLAASDLRDRVRRVTSTMYGSDLTRGTTRGTTCSGMAATSLALGERRFQERRSDPWDLIGGTLGPR